MQLEYELQIVNNKYMEYESIINQMEHDMVQIQKIWNKGQNQQSKTDTHNIATSPTLQENKHASVQAIVDLSPKGIQTDPYTCCLNKKETNEVEVQTICFEENDDSENLKFEEKTKESTKKNTEMEVNGKEKSIYSKENVECNEQEVKKEKETTKENNDQEISLLREQLDEALKLVSERSSTLIKYELQITECQAKIDSLNKIVKSKDLELTQKKKLLDEYKLSSELEVTDTQCNEYLALKSTINSLQKLLSQKEETIARYQNLLKEDRDEHSKAAARLQEEIKNLHIRILSMECETQRSLEKHDNGKNNTKEEPEKLIDKSLEITSKTEDIRNIAMRVEEIARLQEKVSTLEADLNITKELSDRWHRLAEERLKHMDRMRER